MSLRVLRLDQRAIVPRRAYEGDAGLDLHALERRVLAAGERAAVATGVAVEITEGQAGLVLPRPGPAHRPRSALVHPPRLDDAGYRGRSPVLLLDPRRCPPSD